MTEYPDMTPIEELKMILSNVNIKYFIMKGVANAQFIFKLS